jgi:uncharacterized protein YndB with AHSA1/START domain
MPEPMCPPDLSGRPFELTVERYLPAPAAVVYWAWTEGFDHWFAEPGAVALTARVDAPYFFETYHEGRRHPHYGRFLRVEPPWALEFTWLNEAGTRGHETVLSVRLRPEGDGTVLRLHHAGFPDADVRDGHESAWRDLLEHRLLPALAAAPNRTGG